MTDETIDLKNCDREPIHIPNLIQPHGVLLVLQDPTLEIIQVSSNTQEVIGRQPEKLLGKPLSDLLDAKQIKLIQQCLAEDFESINPLNLSIKCLNKSIHFDGIVHRLDTTIILEFEQKKARGKAGFFDFYQQVRGTITRIQKAPTLLEMCEIVVTEVRRITGFERVMVYQFDREGAGSVIAEDTSLETPYLDLHYPPSDIPKQARQLYTLNWLRLIPDASYQPVGLIPANNPLTNQPLDLSLSVLRSVSPIHLEYLQNMGVTASMSISLMHEQKLWGLIACHHSSPKYVSYNIRTMCEFIGQVMSVELVNKEASEDIDYKSQLKSLQTQFVEELSQAEYFRDGMVQLKSQLLNLVSATGAVICSDNQYIRVGKTPSEEEVHALLNWIKPHFFHNLFETRSLAKNYPAAESFQAIASGVLALEISRVHHNYILWFRPEVIQTVNWGGNPNKPVEVSSDGSLRISPRKSFQLWQETVQGSALPWKPCEVEAVIELRSLVVGVVLRQADKMASMNFELQRSNEELDSFAYVASHDLKEPLRGIHNYANFLMEDYADVLDDDGIAKLQTLVRLTQRMEDLINSLLHFSRLGRAELSRQSVNLNEVVQQVIATLTIARPQSEVEFRIPQPLNNVQGDRAQINELFSNLMSNAVKYNDKPQKWVEIGFIEGNGESKIAPTSVTFYVRDNGIGISQEYLDKIFEIFRRLHGRDEFGGGTGVGLTIARKIVERHGGRIWVESTPTLGSTFYFTLSAEANK
ncbi:ATP-binding protein [Nostoc sp. 'Peltigera membranacea cyanobiont' 232]|uniref:ATP-binding protein n=1 Tax=Nostoc sp. 'Peltigera membranacea cyanobiont' 232 TaxID=2014531 RepID=UPI000B950607|nr:ATP-binding protein [Nostoc sp. 'Peltigera membranacea cyanobiont' 232]OYE05743.1 cyanobacterial phytochrome A [Nostoc sp. 'Peltigera membranacea cyanobiont' 232]